MQLLHIFKHILYNIHAVTCIYILGYHSTTLFTPATTSSGYTGCAAGQCSSGRGSGTSGDRFKTRFYCAYISRGVEVE